MSSFTTGSCEEMLEVARVLNESLKTQLSALVKVDERLSVADGLLVSARAWVEMWSDRGSASAVAWCEEYGAYKASNNK